MPLNDTKRKLKRLKHKERRAEKLENIKLCPVCGSVRHNRLKDCLRYKKSQRSKGW